MVKSYVILEKELKQMPLQDGADVLLPITPEVGSAVNWGTVLTDAPIKLE